MTYMIPKEHQIKMAKEALEVIAKNKLVYIAAEERTGKTLTAIMVCSKLLNQHTILIITKAKAKAGWEDTIQRFPTNKEFIIESYQSSRLHTILNRDIDMVILDEAHSYVSGYPKPSKTWHAIKDICRGKPMIFISATPSSQGYSLLYHQLKLSSYSPVSKYSNFYAWYMEVGIAEQKHIGGGRIVTCYDKCTQAAWDMVKHLFISKTRLSAGFEAEPADVLHYVDLEETTKAIYKLAEKNIMSANGNKYAIESSMERLTKLHMIESGTSIINDEYIILPNNEKIQYILDFFGDTKSLVIFYNYKAELIKLKQYFKNAFLAQGTSYAEGVDFSGYETMIILSMDFSTARYSQRRARQCNVNRDTPIKVHYILTKGAISEQIYETVAKNKKNFIDIFYRPLV